MHYSYSTLVNAPVDRVFRFCMSRIGFCKYFAFPVYWHEGPEFPRKGDVVRFEYKVFGCLWVTHGAEIIEFEENLYYEDRMVAGPYHHFSHRYRFEPCGAGTLVIEEVDFSLGYGDLIDRLFIRPYCRYVHARRHALLQKLFDEPTDTAAMRAVLGPPSFFQDAIPISEEDLHRMAQILVGAEPRAGEPLVP